MTEPIAVDVPAKPAFPRSAPPAPAPLSVLPPPKSEASKPAGLTPPPVDGPEPLPPTPNPAGSFFARFTRKQLRIGAVAVIGVAAGIGALRLMFPGDDTGTATSATNTAREQPSLPPNNAAGPPALVAPPSITVDPPAGLASGDGLPQIPAPSMAPLPPGAPPATAKPIGITPLPDPALPPVAPAAFVDPRTPAPPSALPPVPPPSDFALPPIPTPGVTPASGMTPPAAPPSAPPIPPLPATPVGGMNTPPVTPPTPPAGMGAPVVPPPSMAPITPPKGMDKVPEPVFPMVPAPPATGGSVMPPVTPVVPPTPPAGSGNLPLIPAPGSTPEPKTPSVLPPIDVTPKADLKPPVDVTPKPPGVEPPATGTPTGFTKPGGATEVKPLVPELAPKTDFDVDLYEPKAGDSYESISQEYYNDRRFAAALKAFNQNQALTGQRYVSVPPIHILRKRFGAQPGGVVPVGGSPSGGPNWGPAGGIPDPTPARATGNSRGTFVVPQGGMTLESVAKQIGVPWRDLYDLNPQHLPGALIPAGTELRMPTTRLP